MSFYRQKTTNKNPETDLSQPKRKPVQQNSPSTIKEVNEREDKDIKKEQKEKTLSSLNPSPVLEEANNSQSDSQSAPADEIKSPGPKKLKQRGEKFYLEENYGHIFETDFYFKGVKETL